MPAPVAVARQAPNGVKLKDGFASFISFANNPDIAFWEKTVKPPGIDGGDKIDQTTMHNVDYRTYAARYLVDITDSTVTAAYDPAFWADILSQVNTPTTVTVEFPDGSTLAFFGYLKMFDPQELVDGEQPEAQIEIVATNVDPVSCQEFGPVMVEGQGTFC